MRLLRVGVGMWVNADEVMLVQQFNTRPATRERARAEGAGQLYDATGGTKKRQTCRSLVTLKNGVVIASPVHAETLTLRPILEARVTASTKRNSPARESFEPELHAAADGTVHAVAKEFVDEEQAPPPEPPRRRRLFGRGS